jgi:hypothetical protein
VNRDWLSTSRDQEIALILFTTSMMLVTINIAIGWVLLVLGVAWIAHAAKRCVWAGMSRTRQGIFVALMVMAVLVAVLEAILHVAL